MYTHVCIYIYTYIHIYIYIERERDRPSPWEVTNLEGHVEAREASSLGFGRLAPMPCQSIS